MKRKKRETKKEKKLRATRLVSSHALASFSQSGAVDNTQQSPGDTNRASGIVIPPDSPCPCERGRSFADCCLRGNSFANDWSVEPKGARTGKTIKGCFLSGDRNCDKGLSGDHAISAGVLREFATDKVVVVFKQRRFTATIKGDATKVNCLCRRHNEALDPIDYQAKRLFRAVRRAEDSVDGRDSSSGFDVLSFGGFDIERWMLKTLVAIYHAKWLVDPREFLLPGHTAELFKLQMEKPQGLYVPASREGSPALNSPDGPPVHATLLTENKLVTGIEVGFRHLRLRYLLAGSPHAVRSEQLSGVFRPEWIEFSGNGKAHRLLFFWDKRAEAQPRGYVQLGPA